MFNLGVSELALIFVIALIFLGPKQLPELAKTLGKVFRDLKRATNDITDTFQREVTEITDIKNDIKKDVKENMNIQLLPDGNAISKTEKPKNDKPN